ncbi:MAG: helix-hairpin-helix domain-containing protein [Bryobacteraceae bacterium]|jgi:competence protein ComEA
MHALSRKLALCLGSVALLSFNVRAQDLPDGEGKQLVEKICSSCHGLETALADGYSEASWRKLVNTMISRGAEGTDEEFDLVVKYLAKNFPEGGAKVSVNKAAAKDLATALSLSEKDAGAIVSYRQEHGNFKDLSDLKKVPGVDAQKIDAAKDKISFD